MKIVLDLQGAQSESKFLGIGSYSLDMAQAIAREAGNHEIWLALSGNFPDSIEPLRAAFADLIPTERIRVFELPGSFDEIVLANSWRMQASELLRENFLADLRPDIVHVSALLEEAHEGVVASVGRLVTTPTAVTLYNLQQMLHAESYLADTSQKHLYLRRVQSLKRSDLLLVLSNFALAEAIDALQIAPERVRAIGCGVGRSHVGELSESERDSLLASYGLHRPFVMYTGGEDPLKNLEGLIAAFVMLPKDVRTAFQLAIACELSESTRKRLADLTREKGLEVDAFVCPGQMTDEHLRLLYASCAVLVFPSLHEGSGLPILEAMVCGAPVIGSNCASVPEIISRRDALFDPRQPHDIADRLATVLMNGDLRKNLKIWGRERAEAFSCETSARKALQAFEELHDKCKNVRMTTLPAVPRRPLLAFVSPLPPERTGIADYCGNLLPNLARHYEIVCIVDQPEVSDSRIIAEFAIRDVPWFEDNGTKFERILYHFGNSAYHKHMFDLIERLPGVAVLHDFYLGDLLNLMANRTPGCFTKALYESHGFSALELNRSSGCAATTAAYPCNAAVLRDSVGVIVHSEYAVELARRWYGDRVLAFTRWVPFLAYPSVTADRSAARARLDLPSDAFVVSSFGFLHPNKLNRRLLEVWLASPLSEDESCFLVFVGESPKNDYGQKLLETIAGSSGAARIRITGYVEESHYLDHLAAADLAVQLRTCGRGETSAAIFDCLSYNVPLIVNAHGSAAELPDDVVIKLDDDFADADFSDALLRLRTSPEARQNLSKRGESYLRELHHPERVAELYRNAIEELYATSSVAGEQKLLGSIRRISAPSIPSDSDLAAVATAIAANRERFGSKQMLVDVTNVAKSDLRTGIERVTRAVLMALLGDPPSGYRVEPVRAAAGGYVYARRFACRCLALPEGDLADDPVETGHGDIFIGVDWCAHVISGLVPWFETQKRRGVRLVFTIYDLLPVLQPQMFPPDIEPRMRHWLDALTMIADGLVCISRTVADELLGFLQNRRRRRCAALRVGFFHLGADLRASLPTGGLPENSMAVLASMRSRPSFLMVGTLEPRKGHRQAIAAMELLWTDNVEANLVILGKKGWMVDDLAERIEQHPELNNRFFWLQGVSDEMLDNIYRSACALLAASEGEGFGLPLVEAAQYGLAIIARDIPVFREVAGDHAFYFRAESAQTLADTLKAWLSLGDATPSSAKMPWLTWHQSSRQLLDVVLRDRWYGSWPDSANSFGSAITDDRSIKPEERSA